MILSENFPHILSNLYEYDFSSCYFRLLKNINYDISNINFEDKKIRNIQIGLLQKDNPVLAKFLLEKTKNLIDLYLLENDLIDENVVWRQKDGIIVNKPLKKLNLSLPIDYRNSISKLISTMKRDKLLIIYSNNSVVVKGVRNKPIDLSFYDLFNKINFIDRKEMFISLDILRNKIFNSENVFWFSIEKDNNIYIPIKKMGTLKLTKSSLLNINPNDIDKNVLWEQYVWPYCQTLMIYYSKL